jgi:hypothetical protein
MNTIPNIPTSVIGLTQTEANTLSRLSDVFEAKFLKNIKRVKYYEAKQAGKSSSVAIPEILKQRKATLGWAKKAVDVLGSRSMFDGFIDFDLGINDIFQDNAFSLLYPQAVTSELIHSCSFITASKGISTDEPEVVINFYSALKAAAIWNYRNREIAAGLVINDTDGNGNPTQITMYLAASAIVMQKTVWNFWRVTNRIDHAIGCVPMVALVYKPSLDRPFGNSRINRATMNIIDNAVNALELTEISAEFYTAPQRWILGISEEAANGADKFKMYLGAINMLTRDEDGNMPNVLQLPAQSFEPHLAHMRYLASLFAAETGLPLSSLGIVQDNPSSADAMKTAKDDLVVEAQSLNLSNSHALQRLAKITLAIKTNAKSGIYGLPDEARNIKPRFINPALPSTIQRADTIVKLISAFPFLANTDIALLEAGFTSEQLEEIRQEQRRSDTKSAIDVLLEVQNDNKTVEYVGEGQGDSISEIKAGEDTTLADGE